jgi:hypothetical protein
MASFGGACDVTPISGPVPMRAGGLIKPPSISGGLPWAYAPGEPSAVCSCSHVGSSDSMLLMRLPLPVNRPAEGRPVDRRVRYRAI